MKSREERQYDRITDRFSYEANRSARKRDRAQAHPVEFFPRKKESEQHPTSKSFQQKWG